MAITIGQKEYFKGISAIKYEGQESDNPLAFRWYDETKIVAGKTMKEYLRFACAYWHSFCGSGADPFGEPTHLFAWNEKADAIDRAKDKADAAFAAAACIGCGACVAACKNSSALLFVSAKVSHLALLPQGGPERKSRALKMVAQMDKEGFGACTNTGACEAVCPKEISITNIARLNAEFTLAGLLSDK